MSYGEASVWCLLDVATSAAGERYAKAKEFFFFFLLHLSFFLFDNNDTDHDGDLDADVEDNSRRWGKYPSHHAHADTSSPKKKKTLS